MQELVGEVIEKPDYAVYRTKENGIRLYHREYQRWYTWAKRNGLVVVRPKQEVAQVQVTQIKENLDGCESVGYGSKRRPANSIPKQCYSSGDLQSLPAEKMVRALGQITAGKMGFTRQ